MNNIFKVIWNHSTQSFVVASELSRAKGKTKSVSSKNILSALAVGALATNGAMAAVGSMGTSPAIITITSSTSSSTLQVTSTSTTNEEAKKVKLGEGVSATGEQSIAIGANSNVTGYQSISVGVGNQVSGRNAGAFGDPSIVAGSASYTFGNDNVVGSTTTGVFVLGNNNQMGATPSYQGITKKVDTTQSLKDLTDVSDSVAIGNENKVTTKDTFILGSGINTAADGTAAQSGTVANSVYLGKDSTAVANAGKNKTATDTNGATTTGGATGIVDSATIGEIRYFDKDSGKELYKHTDGKYYPQENGRGIAIDESKITTVNTQVTYDNFAGANSTGAVTVGSAGGERRIMNVAAGEISATSTDAVNGSQLFAMAKTLGSSLNTYFHTNDNTNHGTGNATTNEGKLSDAAGAGAKFATTAGVNAVVKGVTSVNSIAIGYGANIQEATTKNNSTVVGSSNSIAMGTDATIKGQKSVAIGYNTSIQAPEDNETSGVAIGDTAKVDAKNSIAIGHKALAKATGQGSAMAIGDQAKASNTYALAMGTRATATGDHSTAIAKNAHAYSQNSVVIGVDAITGELGAPISEKDAETPAEKRVLTIFDQDAGTVTVQDGKKVITYKPTGKGYAEIAIGNRAKATGNRALAMGLDANSQGASAIAIGQLTETLEKASQSTAIGYNAKTELARALALGNKANAKGVDSTAIGTGSVANSTSGFAIGSKANSTGTNSFAVGTSATTAAANTLALGTESKANTQFGVAMGYQAQAGTPMIDEVTKEPITSNVGFRAVAIGYTAKALANDTIVIGTNAQATDVTAISIGRNTTNAGSGSVAIGDNVKISDTADRTVVLGREIDTLTKADNVILGSRASEYSATINETSYDSNGQIKDKISQAIVGNITYGGFAGASAAGVVSIGRDKQDHDNIEDKDKDKDGERRIINVAAGEISARSTDAINGSQLYSVLNTLGPLSSAKVYFHTNDGTNNNTGDATTNSGKVADAAGATALNAVTAGVNATAKAENATAIGFKADARGTNSMALGTSTRAGENAVALGNKTTALGSGTVAIGNGAFVNARSENGIAIGNGARAVNPAAGPHLANAQAGIAIGALANAGQNGIDIGQRTQSVIDANKRYSEGGHRGATVIGTESYNGARHSSILGSGTQIKTDNTEAGKYTANAGVMLLQGVGAVSSGVYNLIDASASDKKANGVANVVNGSGNKVSGSSGTFVLGSGNSIENAYKDDEDESLEAIYKFTTTGNAAELAKAKLGSVILLGNSNTLNGVTDSLVAGTGNRFNNIINSQLLGSNINATAGTKNLVVVGDNTTVTVANATALGTNAKVEHTNSVALGTGSSTKEGVNTNKATVGSVTYEGFAGSTVDGVVSVGSEGKERQIQNVAAGQISEKSTDAINGSQLYSVAAKLAEVDKAVSNVSLSFSGDVAEDTATTNTFKRTNQQETKIVGGQTNKDKLSNGNIGVVSNGSNTLTVKLAKDIKIDSVTTGNSTLDNTGLTIKAPTGGKTTDVKLTNTGLNNGGNTITNVAAGVADTDAVNVSQLNDVKASINNSGFTLKASGNVEGTATPEKIGQNGTVEMVAGKNLTVKQEADGKITYATANDVDFNNVTATNSIGITNGPTMNTTGINAAGNKVSGVADGDITPTSKDAVNGSQIYALSGGNINKVGDYTVTNPDGTKTTYQNVVLDENGEPVLVTYNVKTQGEHITNSVITAINNMNSQGIKFFHTNDGKADSTRPSDQRYNSEDSSASGAYATAVGYQSEASGTSSVAMGNNSTAAGENAIAIGVNAQANAKNTISIGNGNIVNGENSGAFGDPSKIDAKNSYSVGNNNELAVGQSDVFALGNEIKETTSNSVFLGSKSGSFEQKGSTRGNNGVHKKTANSNYTYRGENDANVAGVENAVGVVSVGNANETRQIQGVAAGVVSETSTDAINGSQLHYTNKAIGDVKNDINKLGDTINKNNRNLRAGIAGANAAAGLPQVYLPGKSMVAASAGTFKGEGALAVGYSRASDNGKAILKLQGNANTRGEVGGSVGVGYQW